MKIKTLLAAIGTCLAFGVAGGANANVTYDITSTHGTAHFDWSDATHLALTLTDGFNPTDQIAKELDGFYFSLSGGTASSITSVVAASVITCTSGTCVAAPGPFPAAYGWNFANTGTTFALLASGNGGVGSLHPYAVVNPNVVVADGIPNAQHNPLLVGPVTFNLVFTGLTTVPGTGGGTFLFGTQPATETGTCTTNCGGGPPLLIPEPQSLALLALGLLSLAVIRRRRAR